jgi:hypothetical protein
MRLFTSDLNILHRLFICVIDTIGAGKVSMIVRAEKISTILPVMCMNERIVEIVVRGIQSFLACFSIFPDTPRPREA